MDKKVFKRVCIVGSGFMGAHIGLHCAVKGYNVQLVDTSVRELQKASERQSQELDTWIADNQITHEEKESILSRIQFTRNLEEGASTAELVIEAVPERLEIKREIFSQLDDICSQNTILATNSSSIRVSKIEDAVKRQDKVLNMHFYSYVWRRPMVELMRGNRTSDETIERILSFARTIDVTPLIVRKESTGFIFNRVWRAIKKECLHVVDDGVASPEDVDRAFMISLGVSMGPFGMMDRVGLDVVRDIEMVYFGESGDPGDAPPKLLMDKIEKGELGIKTNKGFYSYPNPAFQRSGWLKGNE
jgi:3-hydroxybutyryl-CoA dehydrogenase